MENKNPSIYSGENNNKINNKKHKKSLSYFTRREGNMDVEKNTEIFNSLISSENQLTSHTEMNGNSSSLGEATEKKCFIYEGPIFNYSTSGTIFKDYTFMETMAYSINQARLIFRKRAKKETGNSISVIDNNRVKECEKKKENKLYSDSDKAKKEITYEQIPLPIEEPKEDNSPGKNESKIKKGNSMKLIEKLNELDKRSFDKNTKYYDLVNLYEAVNPTLTPQDKEEIKKVINNTNDPKVISAVLSAKLNKEESEKNESLEESTGDNLFAGLKDWILDVLQIEFASKSVVNDIKQSFPEYNEEYFDEEYFNSTEFNTLLKNFAAALADGYVGKDGIYESLSDDIRTGNLKHGNSLVDRDASEEEIYDADKYDDSFGYLWQNDLDSKTEIQIQDRETRTHDLKSPSPKTSSNSWGRVWKNGELVKQFEGPKYVVRKDMADYLDEE